MKIGHKLKHYREQKGLSQKDVAEKLFLSRQAISRWENDKNIPDIDNLQKLCKLYDISMDTLFQEMDENQETKQDSVVNNENYIRDMFLIAILVISCLLDIIGVFISIYILWYCIKQKKNKFLIIISIMAIIICVWNAYAFINTFFLHFGTGIVEKL